MVDFVRSGSCSQAFFRLDCNFLRRLHMHQFVESGMWHAMSFSSSAPARTLRPASSFEQPANHLFKLGKVKRFEQHCFYRQLARSSLTSCREQHDGGGGDVVYRNTLPVATYAAQHWRRLLCAIRCRHILGLCNHCLIRSGRPMGIPCIRSKRQLDILYPLKSVNEAVVHFS